MDLGAENLDTRLRTPRTAAYYLGFLCLGLMDASLGPTLPWLAGRVGMTVGAAGVFFTLRAGGYAIGSFVTGKLYDQWPGHRVMAAGMAVVAVALAAVPGMSNVALLGVAMLATGAGAGALDVGGNTLLAWIHGERIAPYMNGLHLFFGIGALISPTIVAQAFARGVGPEWAYWATAGAVTLSGLWIALLPSPAVRLRNVRHEHEHEREHEDEHERHGRFIALVAAALAVYVGLEIGFGGWAFTYGVGRAGLSKADAAYLTAVYWGAFTAGRFVSIPVLAWLGRVNERTTDGERAARRTVRQVLWGALGGTAGAIGVLWMSGTGGGLWVGAMLLGFTIGPIFPTLISLAEAHAKLTGGMTSMLLIGAGLGAMALPWLIGVVMQRLGAATLMPALALDLGVLVLLVGALSPWLSNEVVRPPPRAAL